MGGRDVACVSGGVDSIRRGMDRYGLPTNQARAVVSVFTKSRSIWATICLPEALGWVPSALKFEQAQVSPSQRGFSPSAQRYGPHESHGATALGPLKVTVEAPVS